MTSYPVTDRLDYERGAICERCGRRFNLGEPYTTVLEGMVGDSPFGIAWCLPCSRWGYRPAAGVVSPAPPNKTGEA